MVPAASRADREVAALPEAGHRVGGDGHPPRQARHAGGHGHGYGQDLHDGGPDLSLPRIQGHAAECCFWSIAGCWRPRRCGSLRHSTHPKASSSTRNTTSSASASAGKTSTTTSPTTRKSCPAVTSPRPSPRTPLFTCPLSSAWPSTCSVAEGAFAQTASDPDYEDEDAARLDIPIHAFDVIIADECHRGYTASDTATWRAVLDHFDAIKIGLTATPAAHTLLSFMK